MKNTVQLSLAFALLSLSSLSFIGCKQTLEPNKDLSSSSEAKNSSSSENSSSSLVTSGPTNHTPGPIEKSLNPKPCLATFKKDYTVFNYFKEKLFDIKAGESFIVQSGLEWFGRTNLYKEDEGHLINFDLDETQTNEYLTFSCVTATAPQYFVNFKELDFYKEADLKTKVCTLPAGTVISTEETGYMSANNTLGTYEMSPENTQPGCSGGQFVAAEEFELYGTHYIQAALGAYLGMK